MTPMQWVEIGAGLVAALFAGSKARTVLAARKAKRAAVKEAIGK